MTLRKRTVFAVTLVAPADLTISTADTLDSWVRRAVWQMQQMQLMVMMILSSTAQESKGMVTEPFVA